MAKSVLEENGFSIVTNTGVVYTDPLVGINERAEIFRADMIDIVCEEQRKREKNQKNIDEWD